MLDGQHLCQQKFGPAGNKSSRLYQNFRHLDMQNAAFIPDAAKNIFHETPDGLKVRWTGGLGRMPKDLYIAYSIGDMFFDVGTPNPPPMSR